jgi:hypothetical protein
MANEVILVRIDVQAPNAQFGIEVWLPAKKLERKADDDLIK